MMAKRLEWIIAAALMGGSLLGSSGRALAVESPYNFVEIVEQGFGDRQNTKAWAMVWWKDHLYVGTARAHLCMNWAGLSIVRDRWEYPPRSFVDPGGTDPDLDCAPDFRDLPLQAEIWRYSPVTEEWTRVFQSELIQNPADPTRETARDIGIRNLIPFVDPDGTESLYAAGITSESINPGMPPPRLLRTSDGVHWSPVPQDPGTVFGELGRRNANLRGAAVFKGRLYIVAGNLQGTGPLLVSANPAGGNNEFRFVTTEDMQIFELIEYNGSLYLGLGTAEGYQVAKTDGEGDPLLDITPVVETAGGIKYFMSKGVASMHVSHGRLYVGTDKPAELIRVNPDDSWDLIVGKPRGTTQGRKEPLSGLMTGFDYLMVNHFHRMTTYQNNLFLSTNDATGFMKIYRVGRRFLPNMGFDLYVSPNGVDFSMLTLTGLESPFDIVMRTWEPTPYGLFGGTSNPWYGLRMYRVDPVPQSLAAPQHLGSEPVGAAAALSWQGVPGATRYRVYRRATASEVEFQEIASTTDTFFLDASSRGRINFHYFVVAEKDGCCTSAPSNVARWPLLLRPMSVKKLDDTATEWNGGTPMPGISATLGEASTLLRQGDVSGARALLTSLATGVPSAQASPEPPADSATLPDSIAQPDAAATRRLRGDLAAPRSNLGTRRSRLQTPPVAPSPPTEPETPIPTPAIPGWPSWRVEDFNLFLQRLLTRFQLVENGILSPQALMR
jgi:hypothetical protein